MRAKMINEWGSAGFAVGGGHPMLRGNRGGFGGGSNLGGPNTMYSYEIKSLNRTLQPRPQTETREEEIRVGNTIRGKELNRDVYRIGTILKICKSYNGALKYYKILDTKISKILKIDPTSAYLLSGGEHPDKFNIQYDEDHKNKYEDEMLDNELD